MLEEKEDGWFVVNVKDAKWLESEAFGKVAHFQMQGSFPDLGINLFVVQPGQPLCRYHRENAQEGFLVLSGECKLLVNEEERDLRTWDFVHCPPGVTHVLIGAGSTPAAVLAIGHRKGEDHQLFYPASELARTHGAEVPEPTDTPAKAYADLKPRAEGEPAAWPLD